MTLDSASALRICFPVRWALEQESKCQRSSELWLFAASGCLARALTRMLLHGIPRSRRVPSLSLSGLMWYVPLSCMPRMQHNMTLFHLYRWSNRRPSALRAFVSCASWIPEIKICCSATGSIATVSPITDVLICRKLLRATGDFTYAHSQRHCHAHPLRMHPNNQL